MSLIDLIFDAGVVGCGGAGFPTHAKLAGSIRHYIINGAECEPLLGCDRYIMRHKAEEIILAAAAVREAVKADSCTLALKKHYTKEIEALSAAIAKTGAPVAIHTMENIYPAGDEQVMVEDVTGRVVPPGGIPLDVGAAVNNVATLLAIHDAMQGIPLTWKYLTMGGEVGNPCILRVLVGTSVADCIGLAGGVKEDNCVVLLGGPMMGEVIPMAEAASAVVTKTTSGILVLPGDSYLANKNNISIAHMKNRAASACIQCSLCTQLCPRHLLGHPLEPHKIMRKLATSPDIAGLLDDPDIQRAALCCECGVCEVCACPMELQPRRVNAMFKGALAKEGVRYPKGEGDYSPRPQWRMRKVPSQKAAARAGVLSYYGHPPDTLIEAAPGRIALPLKQHIGSPAEPIVREGDRVAAGQLVARCPEGKLGANIHTGISGIVTSVSHQIIVEGRA